MLYIFESVRNLVITLLLTEVKPNKTSTLKKNALFVYPDLRSGDQRTTGFCDVCLCDRPISSAKIISQFFYHILGY